MFNILYDNKILYKELTEEELRNVLFQLSEKAADGQIDSNLINVEEV
jgi:hypothetical protein